MLPPDSTGPNVSIPALLTDETGKKRGRTNTPWTAQEEQRLKQMRDAGHSWNEIAKVLVFCPIPEKYVLIVLRLSLLGRRAVSRSIGTR